MSFRVALSLNDKSRVFLNLSRVQVSHTGTLTLSIKEGFLKARPKELLSGWRIWKSIFHFLSRLYCVWQQGHGIRATMAGSFIHWLIRETSVSWGWWLMCPLYFLWWRPCQAPLMRTWQPRPGKQISRTTCQWVEKGLCKPGEFCPWILRTSSLKQEQLPNLCVGVESITNETPGGAEAPFSAWWEAQCFHGILPETRADDRASAWLWPLCPHEKAVCSGPSTHSFGPRSCWQLCS